MNDTHIRAATEDDLEALLDLYITLHEFHAHRLPDRLRIPETYNRAELQAEIKGLLQQTDTALLVIESSGKLVGLAEVSMRKDEVDPSTVSYTYGYLQSLVLLEAFRKHGLGTRLLEAAERWTRERGGTELRLSVWEFAEGPLAFYKANGYATLKRSLVKRLS